MTEFLFIRHGESDYSPVDARGFIGQGRSLAPLSPRGVEQIKASARDPRLKGCDIILSSPYTRALQSAAIISRELDMDIIVEVDLHEWVPNIDTFAYKTSEECFALAKDFEQNKGVHPVGEKRVWETYESMKNRMDKVLDRYMSYDRVIVVCHGMIMRTQKYQEKIENGEILVVRK